MPLSREILAKCEALSRLGIEFPLALGARVARGFADLGYEEFQILSNDTLVSLFTRQITPLQESERRFFFRVPEPDLAIERLEADGFRVDYLQRHDARRWEIQCTNTVTEEHVSLSGGSLEEVVIDALLRCSARSAIAPLRPERSLKAVKE